MNDELKMAVCNAKTEELAEESMSEMLNKADCMTGDILITACMIAEYVFGPGEESGKIHEIKCMRDLMAAQNKKLSLIRDKLFEIARGLGVNL